MTLSLTALGALLSLSLLPFALQVSVEGNAVSVPKSAPDLETGFESGEPVDIAGPERDGLLTEISRALGSVETAKGRFVQFDEAYNQTSGDFYLRRPGRVRFEYDAPSPLLIIADGTSVAIEDKDLETQDRIPLRATPLALILDNNIAFDDRVNVLAVRKAAGVIGVMLEDATGETDGNLLLVVDAADFSLVEWQTSTSDGRTTSVQLAGVETGIRLNPRLFRIEELGAEDERE